mmetsp:Transcript_10502/g.26983  ORF Transcript_10502/g.26983 Transcript_10502/m.26983 type:complete len:231 (-) Transcript_10502:264-956(-)
MPLPRLQRQPPPVRHSSKGVGAPQAPSRESPWRRHRDHCARGEQQCGLSWHLPEQQVVAPWTQGARRGHQSPPLPHYGLQQTHGRSPASPELRHLPSVLGMPTAPAASPRHPHPSHCHQRHRHHRRRRFPLLLLRPRSRSRPLPPRPLPLLHLHPRHLRSAPRCRGHSTATPLEAHLEHALRSDRRRPMRSWTVWHLGRRAVTMAEARRYPTTSWKARDGLLLTQSQGRW